jgi:hypothetical protein
MDGYSNGGLRGAESSSYRYMDKWCLLESRPRRPDLFKPTWTGVIGALSSKQLQDAFQLVSYRGWATIHANDSFKITCPPRGFTLARISPLLARHMLPSTRKADQQNLGG